MKLLIHGRALEVEFLPNPGSARTVVFIHGWMDSLHDMDRVVPELARRMGVLRFDLPGHGDSEQLQSYSLGEYAAHAREVMTRLDVGRPVLVGHSMGAAVALALLASDRAAYERVILVDPLMKPLPAAVRLGGRALIAVGGSRISTGFFRRLWNSGPWLSLWCDFIDGHESERTHWARMATTQSARAVDARAIYDGYREVLRNGFLARVPAPGELVDVIYGESDPLIDRGALASSFPADRVFAVANARHTPNRTQPEAFSEVLVRILLGEDRAAPPWSSGSATLLARD